MNAPIERVEEGFSTEYHYVRLEAQRIHPEAKLPYRGRNTDAGYDLYSVESKIIPVKDSAIIKTGIKISCPPGFYYTIAGRSSLWTKKIFPNGGIIDATYTGEVWVSLVNVSNTPFEINKGDRIAQLLIHRQYDAHFVEVEKFSPAYDQRGENGFGSSGK